jgi:hypothetical protein
MGLGMAKKNGKWKMGLAAERQRRFRRRQRAGVITLMLELDAGRLDVLVRHKAVSSVLADLCHRPKGRELLARSIEAWLDRAR